MTPLSEEQRALKTWICTKCGRSGVMEVAPTDDVQLTAVGYHGENYNGCPYLPWVVDTSPYIVDMYTELASLRERLQKVEGAANNLAHQVIEDFEESYPRAGKNEPDQVQFAREYLVALQESEQE